MNAIKCFVTTVICLQIVACASTMNDKLPETSVDGLERLPSKSMDAVYWKKGALLDSYDSVAITEVTVEFRNNWLRNQNSQRTGVSNRISQQDMDDIRAAVAELFLEVFSNELEGGGYNVVTETGENVLLLEPSIVDLDVTAPDISMKQTGMSNTYTSSAGEMTLNMELYDSATHALIGRVIDRRKDYNSSFMTRSSSVTNRSEATRMMRQWAIQLRKALDEAHGKS
jgi:hypothetical protein